MPDRQLEPIPIVGGTGELGTALARRWALAGAPVVLGSRSEERAAAAARELAEDNPGTTVSGAENSVAVSAAEVVVMTVPFAAQANTLKEVKEALRPGQILVDATVPLATAVGGRPTRSIGVWQGSAAQQAQEMVPDGVTVVAALHTVGAPGLADREHEVEEDVLICGDRVADRERVAATVELIAGLRGVHAGTLEMAGIVEQLTPMLISINRRYKTHAGIRITGLPSGAQSN